MQKVRRSLYQGAWQLGQGTTHQRPTIDLLWTHHGLATGLPQAVPDCPTLVGESWKQMRAQTTGHHRVACAIGMS